MNFFTAMLCSFALSQGIGYNEVEIKPMACTYEEKGVTTR
jgi:hypothetical protein